MIPTLEEAKTHLRIEQDFIDDDFYVQQLILSAVSLVERFTDSSIGDLDYPAVKQAILIKVGDFYDVERNSYTGLKNNESFERLLLHFRKIIF
jgi:hypothetical protein